MFSESLNTELFTTLDNNLLNLINIHKNTSNINNQINSIESTYNTKLDNLKQSYKNIDINYYKTLTSLELIQKEVEIIKIILKYSLLNSELDITIIKNSLNYLLVLSNILKKRLNQKDNFVNIKNSDLYRCSYKFCNFKGKCNYYYNKKHSSKCYQDHYVHNRVSFDIKILLQYMDSLSITNNLFKQNKEILKTLNTLAYVINHMENELKSKCIYYEKKDWDKFH